MKRREILKSLAACVYAGAIMSELNEYTLEQAIIDIGEFKTDRGHPLQAIPQKLILTDEFMGEISLNEETFSKAIQDILDYERYRGKKINEIPVKFTYPLKEITDFIGGNQ